MPGNKDYLVGRGRLFFDRFLDGTTTSTGEMYFGNTPGLSAAQAITNLDHFDADQGLRVKDFTIELENTANLTFTVDDMAIENISLWWRGILTTETQIAGAAVPYPINDAVLDRFYQLGSTPANPWGVRNFSAMTMTKGVTAVNAAGNWDADLINGRVYLRLDATDIDPGDDLTVTATPAAGVRALVVDGQSTIYGAMRYISANEGKKKQRNYFWPYIKLSADGDMALKGDDWMNAPFTAEVLQMAGFKRVYIDAPVPAA
jgi:hypothetical protein